MPAERLSMRKIREVLRLQAQGLSDRKIARSVNVSRTAVRRMRERAEEAGVGWPLPEELADSALEALLYPPILHPSIQPRAVPQWSYIHQELRRPGVTLQLLWLEYKATHPEGYQYSRFCALYNAWKDTLDPVLRQEHKAGEKTFVDYAGQTVPVVDAETGEIREAQIFVGVLGASNYTFAEATWTQTLPDWIASHQRMFAFFGGVTCLLVPDNLRSGVSKACRYEPETNPTYQELATHYGTAVLPARKAKPRDKAKVESGVQVVERWILAALRNHTFFSLAELNQEIARLLEVLNNRPFQKLDGTRRSLFESLDRPALKPLPTTPFEYGEWTKPRVNVDYHVDVERHYYSVPHSLLRQKVDVRVTAATVEIFHDGQRVAAHPRSHRQGGFTTDPSHRPEAHQKYLEWTPSRMIRWAEKTGPHTGTVVRQIIETKAHPEQGYRPSLGIIRLGNRYSPERLEAACQRSLAIGGVSYRSIKSILEHGLDRLPLEEQATLDLPQDHDNLRGSHYYMSCT
jgi:transposase